MKPKFCRTRGWLQASVLCVAACATTWVGCGRELTIYRDDVINTDFDRNGAPIEVDIVSVFPSDFRKVNDVDLEEINTDLLPSKGINSKMWFERKPTRESYSKMDPNHYYIPSKRIFSFAANRETTFGNYKGGRIQGAKFRESGRTAKEIVVTGIPVDDIWNDRSVIFVFCKFTNANGEILPTAPAEFRKLGRYKEDLAIHIHDKSVEALSSAKLDRNFEEKQNKKAD
ncbi:MAG: hypothetical protein KF841_06025 [Phycisphaerae bacterium]|nr:hypothetical protein [Phycisphaerae bacterium]